MKPMSRFWKVVLGIALAASIAADFLGPEKEAYAIWDQKVFFAAYGFVGCVVIIFVSKAIGKYWVQKEEDYWEGTGAPEPGTAETGGADV
jgi:hypothetical protein